MKFFTSPKKKKILINLLLKNWFSASCVKCPRKILCLHVIYFFLFFRSLFIFLFFFYTYKKAKLSLQRTCVIFLRVLERSSHSRLLMVVGIKAMSVMWVNYFRENYYGLLLTKLPTRLCFSYFTKFKRRFTFITSFLEVNDYFKIFLQRKEKKKFEEKRIKKKNYTTQVTLTCLIERSWKMKKVFEK